MILYGSSYFIISFKLARTRLTSMAEVETFNSETADVMDLRSGCKGEDNENEDGAP